MFGFVTKAKHEAALALMAERMAQQSATVEELLASRAKLIAEIDHLRPLAQKHLNSLAALKQNKGKGEVTPADCTRRILREHLGVSDEQLTDDAHLADDLGADSLDPVELALAVEDEFSITVTDDETAACMTVGDWIKLVEGRVGL